MKQLMTSSFVILCVLISFLGCVKNGQVKLGDAGVYHERGIVHYNNGEYDKAISAYNKAIEINPKDAESYYNRGRAYQLVGQYDKAIFDYGKAAEINPGFAEAYYNQGLAHFNKGEYGEAISIYNKAIEINPGYAAAYNNRGVAYFYIKEYDNAWSDVNKTQSLGYQIYPEFLKKLHEATGTINSPAAADIKDHVASAAQAPSAEAAAPAGKLDPTPQTELQMAKVPSPKIKPSAGIKNVDEGTVQRENWLLSQDATYYTIQIMGTYNEAFLLSFIKKNQLLKQDEIAYYQTTFNRKAFYQLLYGIYPTKKEAQLASDKLPENIRKAKPWIRSISTVQKTIRERLKR